MLPIKRLVIENSICWEYKSWSDIEYCPVSNVKVNKFQICHLDPALWELNVDSFVMDQIQLFVTTAKYSYRANDKIVTGAARLT